MANNIDLFKQYIPLIDEVYALESTTAIFDGAEQLARMAENGHEFKIPKMTMDGLGEYGRNTHGYPNGNVSLTYETKAPNFDRAVRFTVEAQDDMETAGIAFGKLAGEFMRTKVASEVDAFRYAKYSAAAGTKNNGAIATAEEAVKAISAIMAGRISMP